MRIIPIIAFLAIAISGCSTVETMGTKRDAYPAMYGPNKPVSIVVVPAINESTAAEAGDLLNVTVAQPFDNHGYYVLPMPIVADIFRREGILEGTQVKGIPASVFKKNFGADAVMYLTIDNWDKNYMVVAANVTVGIEYVLLSTETNEVLWSYKEKVVVNTSGSSGSLLADLISTAVSTAITDYVPIAFQVHAAAVKAMPFGKYHPESGKDGDIKSVNLASKDAALGQAN
jgi:hypothetical protein